MTLKFFVTIFILLAIITSGCTEKVKENKINEDIKEEVKEVNIKNISMMAEVFKEGEKIPNEYTCTGKDISPALSWSGIPEDTKSIVLIMEDSDVNFVHWVLFNIPPTIQKLPRGVEKTDILGDLSRQGRTDFGNIGYGGPCPPPGKPHKYYFRIYALDKMLEMMPGASKDQVYNAIKDHILAKGEMFGMYER